jgi:hypothetical protein
MLSSSDLPCNDIGYQVEHKSVRWQLPETKIQLKPARKADIGDQGPTETRKGAGIKDDRKPRESGYSQVNMRDGGYRKWGFNWNPRERDYRKSKLKLNSRERGK